VLLPPGPSATETSLKSYMDVLARVPEATTPSPHAQITFK